VILHTEGVLLITPTSPLINITQSLDSSHSPHITLLHSQHSYCNTMPGSSVRSRAPLTIPDFEWGMDCSRDHMSAVTRRQMTSVRDTEESEAEKEERGAADDKELLPWAQGFMMHLTNYTNAAADEYTKGHLSAAFTNFGKELEVPYSKMDEWEKGYLLAKSRQQTKTAHEIFEYIRERRTAASVSSLLSLNDLVLIVLTPRQRLSRRFRQFHHFVPQKCPLSSHHPTPLGHHSPRDQD
jgi:hypothetical protein